MFKNIYILVRWLHGVLHGEIGSQHVYEVPGVGAGPQKHSS